MLSSFAFNCNQRPSIKGSLNTFLNAMTYPDKTCYPVASCNIQDFRNLVVRPKPTSHIMRGNPVPLAWRDIGSIAY